MLTSVSPDQIEETLQQAWDEAENTDRIKAALFNLIVYIPDLDSEEYVDSLLAPLTLRFPCRLLVLAENPKATEPGVTTEAGMHLIGDPSHLVSSDKIVLRFPPKERYKVPFLITPHLLPHLPIYLLWNGMPHTKDPIYTLLHHHLTEVLFDPPGMEQLPSFARHILATTTTLRGGVSDLVWAETASWRQVLGIAFDSSQRIQQLRFLSNLRIFYAESPDPAGRDAPMGACYLQAWLAAHLGWSLKEQCNRTFVYDPCTVTLQPQPHSALEPGSVVKIQGNNTNHYHFELNLDQPGDYVHFSGGSDQVCEIPTTLFLGRRTRSQILARELLKRGTSNHYYRTLALIRRYYDGHAP